jgi:lipoyl(octanoyl) transferase
LKSRVEPAAQSPWPEAQAGQSARYSGEPRIRPALRVVDLGLKAYGPALLLQERQAQRRQRDGAPDTLLLVEHEPVYTLGRNADERHILISPEERTRRGIAVFRTGRGGDVTYHGPGQLVAYPILRLEGGERGVGWYVGSLERVIVDMLAGLGIPAGTDRAHRGVWIGTEKIAAIGVRVTRSVTLHGFALNVSTDLTAFAGIVPCGIPDRGVTSLHRAAGRPVGMDEVKRRVVRHFVSVFGYAEAQWENGEQKGS